MDVGSLALRAEQVALLWLAGFREACCLHRVVFFCRSSKVLLTRTVQCFLLNGLIFLGSLYMMNSVFIPTLSWILPDQFGNAKKAPSFYLSLRSMLVELFYIFWFYPLYASSFILSSLWYNEIAKHAFAALGNNGLSKAVDSKSKDSLLSSQDVNLLDRPAGIEGVMIGIGEQAYSILLLSFFFVEVIVTGYIPYVGKVLNFILLSWMYSYYSFEYKWNYAEYSFDKRIKFFESNWPFFSGFGSPCVLAIFFFSPLVSYGVMAILYPLFVLTAMGCHAGEVIALRRRTWRGESLGKFPIFFAADYLSMKALQFLPKDVRRTE